VLLHRKFKVTFQADIDPELNWSFEPVQREVIVNAGETALIFYKVVNRDNKPVIGKSIIILSLFVKVFLHMKLVLHMQRYSSAKFNASVSINNY